MNIYVQSTSDDRTYLPEYFLVNIYIFEGAKKYSRENDNYWKDVQNKLFVLIFPKFCTIKTES